MEAEIITLDCRTRNPIHRTAKGSALDVGYANPQLDARIQKGSANQSSSWGHLGPNI